MARVGITTAMGAIGKRVKERRKELGLGQLELAKESGLKQSTISNIETGRNKGSRYVVELAGVLKVRPKWLSTGTGQKEVKAGEREESPKLVFIDRYKDVRLGAGAGIEQIPDSAVDQVAFRDDWLRAKGWKTTALRAVSAQGRSMEPRIQDGDLLMVDTSDATIKNGKVYAIRDQTGDRVKRLFVGHDGSLRIRSDNPAPEFPEEVVPASKVEHIHVIGRVVWIGGAV